MLTRLSIRNIVLIREAELLFDKGLTVLTGETGAGKSILLDALGLVLGNRAEARLVRAGAENAMVIAEYELLPAQPVHALLTEQGLESSETLILRRQIRVDGTSKAFVNDQPVTLKLLRDIGERLVSICGQHGQKGLLDSSEHLKFLDRYAKTEALKATVTAAYHHWKRAERARHALEEQLIEAERNRDYLEHMLKELAALAPQEGEETALVEKRTAMMQAEKSGAALREISELLGGPTPLAARLRNAETLIARSALAATSEGKALGEALERTQAELEEAENILGRLMREDHYDEKLLERTEERLFSLREMARKYRVTVEGLYDLLTTSTAKLSALSDSSAEHARLAEEERAAKSRFQETAMVLRNQRLAAIPLLEAAVHQELSPLKMEATRFRVACIEKNDAAWSESGIDEVRFEVSTNAGSPFGTLGAIASGGELSRLMLALSVVLQQAEDSSMLIFDEIDTGTGGAVADAIGARLARLSAHQQVCVVTHLPQVAARGDSHLFIAKERVGDHTETRVVRLSEGERTEELARMLSGAEITGEARSAALRLREAI